MIMINFEDGPRIGFPGLFLAATNKVFGFPNFNFHLG